MNTYTIKITGSKYSPYSNLPIFKNLDGGFLLDPQAAPLSFFFPLTTNCGTLTGSNSVHSLTTIGGDFQVIYNDLKNYEFTTKGTLVYCKNRVFFNLSDFDQTRSIIKKIVFYTDNENKIQTYNFNISAQSIIYPKLDQSNSIYLPKDIYYSKYNPKIIIQYNDGTTQTINCPLTVAQCGIFDSYRDIKILEAVPLFKKYDKISLFLNDKKNNNLLVNILDVKSPFVFDTIDDVELPFISSPVPVVGGITNLPPPPPPEELEEPEEPEVPEEPNPEEPPALVYRYEESEGIILIPNPADLKFGENFLTVDNNLVLTDGGAPYVEGESVSIIQT